MVFNRNVILVLIITLLIFGCSFFNEENSKADLIKKDRDALKEKVNTYPALLYKYIKINTKISEIDSLKLKELEIEYAEIREISGVFASPESLGSVKKNEISVVDYIMTYRAIKNAKDEVEDFNEDILPSFSEVNEPNANFTDVEIKQQKVNEHIAFALFGLVIRDFGTGAVFYELSMVDPDSLSDDEFKATFQILRNFMLYQKGLYYLSEYELTQNINWIENNPEAHFNTTLNGFGLSNTELSQQMRAQVLIFNYLLRGLDRLKMDNEASNKLAMEDFEAIINTAKDSGIDNEIIQAIEVYFYLKNKNSDNAIIALNRLKDSDILSKNEKKSIDEAIFYLQNRETDKVFNGVYDKIFLSKVISSYIYARAKETDWKKVMEDNDIEIPNAVENSSEQLNDLLRNINKYKSDKAMEDAQKKLKDTGLDLLERSNSILE